MVNFRVFILNILIFQSFNGYSMDILRLHMDHVISGNIEINDLVKEFAELVTNNEIFPSDLSKIYDYINSSTDHCAIRISLLNLIKIWRRYKLYVIKEIYRFKSLNRGILRKSDLLNIKSFKQYYKSKI